MEDMVSSGHQGTEKGGEAVLGVLLEWSLLPATR